MISLDQIPNNVVLLFSGGPASTLLYWLLKDRDLTLCSVDSYSRTYPDPLRIKTIVEGRGAPVRPLINYKVHGADRRLGVQVPRDLLRARGEWEACVAGVTAQIPALDPARRAREQGIVGEDFLYLTTSSSSLFRQGFNRPEGIGDLSQGCEGWVYQPLLNLTVKDVYQEYRALGLEDLWTETHSCCQLTACLKCYDCRARQWAQTL